MAVSESVPTRQRLIRAALELFQQRGYHAVGVTEIHTRARCPKGSLYHHFPGGKAALAIAAVDWLEAEITASFDRAADKAIPADRQISHLFQQTAGWVTGTGYASGALLAVLAQEVVPHEADLSKRLGQAVDAATTALARALAAGGGDPAMAGPILAMLDGAVAQARACHSPAPFEAAETAALRLVR
ncbi:TetR/AcrR family transcriptional regulator [Oceanicola sp. 22II-s10i]|uniref:TetR/AcrR family transcriptional regulator n=1 Tax=Oceanicola sp. 22II-s10i TaxID=1317116 RepID=UPI000B526E2D|nr:TetR/AcrR family transcriptional regulator [Oceanicola sp. 22II-s10i]